MERYSEYKDSGVQWLGEIPKHWEIKKAKYIWQELFSLSEKGNEGLLSVSQNDGITKARNDSRSESLIGYKKVSKDNLVINIMLAWMGGLGVSAYDGIVSPAYCVYKLTDDYNPKFMHYLYKTPQYLAEFARRSTGVIPSRWRMYTDDFGQVLTIIPPFPEQQSIAAYLDAATVKIDKAIAQQQKVIDLLNERKQIIINHAVTKGFNPNFSMKDSGMEWIGKIPGHWEQLPLKYVFEIRNGYTPSKNNKSYWTNGTIPWYRMEDIRKSGRILNESIQYVTHKAVNGKGLFKAGSYIMAICTASIGEHAMLIADSLANQRFANFNIRKSLVEDFDPMYLFYFMYVVGDFCRNNANSTCFQYVDMEALKRFPILKPSKEEQKCIVAYLDKGLKKLNTALEQTKDRIVLLQERKQIIINEVVTGKVKVS